MITFLLMVVFAGALALAAFCAGSETGLLSLNRGRITHLAREGSRAAKILAAALADLPNTVTTLLVGNNLAAVVYSSTSAAIAQRLFPGSPAAKLAWSAAAALAVLYLGEFLPKLFCTARPLRRMLSLAQAFRVFSLALRPLGVALNAAINLFISRRPLPRERLTTGDLLTILKDRKDGVRLTDFESALISRILVLRKKGAEVTPEALLSAIDD